MRERKCYCFQWFKEGLETITNAFFPKKTETEDAFVCTAKLA